LKKDNGKKATMFESDTTPMIKRGQVLATPNTQCWPKGAVRVGARKENALID